MITLKSTGIKTCDFLEIDTAKILYEAAIPKLPLSDLLAYKISALKQRPNFGCYYLPNSNPEFGSAVIVISRQVTTVIWRKKYFTTYVFNPSLETIKNVESFADEIEVEQGRRIFFGSGAGDFIANRIK